MPNFPALPERRINYEIDGTEVFWTQNDADPRYLTETQRREWNNENEGIQWSGNSTPYGSRPGGIKFVWIFPVPMTITHQFLAHGYVDSVGSEAWSADTTNGVDGTWNAISVIGRNADYGLVIPNWRTKWAAFAAPLTGVKSIRFGVSCADGNRWWKEFHFYGYPDTAVTDRVALWDPTLDQEVGANHLNFDDVPRGAPVTKQIRVKNLSATKTAAGTVLQSDWMNNTTPAVPTVVEFSSDGGTTWAESLNIGDLGPGIISGVVQVRHRSTLTATTGVFSRRVRAVPTTFA